MAVIIPSAPRKVVITLDFDARIQLRQRVRALAEPTIERLGCELVAVEWSGDRGGSILRLYIDKPGGVDVSDCTRVTHAISPELDVEDPIEGAYRLEVSSPGMDRPVELARDFQRFAGFRARIKLAPGPARRRYTGTLAGVDGAHLIIDIDGEPHRLAIDRVDRARLDLDLAEFERLGKALTEP